MVKIYVIVEHQHGTVLKTTYEMLAIGQKIASELGAELGAIILGQNVKDIISTLPEVSHVVYLEDPLFTEPIPEAYLLALMQVMEKCNPDIILVGDSNFGSGIGSLLSTKSDLPFITHCKDIKVDNNQILVTSILCGGKIQVKVKPISNKAIIGIIPGEFSYEEGQPSGNPKIDVLEIPDFSQLKSSFVKYIEPDVEAIDITSEDILLGIGRGIQKKENIPIAEEISKLLHGQLCGSRPVIDQGWLPITRQVGRSGNTVNPKLYCSIGISGAPEHIVGMKNSRLIVAINTDAKAPIFNISHYGVVGDAQKLLPLLFEEIKKRKGV